MKKNLIYIVLLLAFSSLMYSQKIHNHGANIYFNDGVKVKMVDIEFVNDDDGDVTIREASEVRLDGGDFRNESGYILITEASIIQTTENLINKGTFLNDELSFTIVFKNVVNYGTINNEHIIEIGED